MNKIDNAMQEQNNKKQISLLPEKKNESTTEATEYQMQKANAVVAQTKFYDKVASLRIHLQKPFQIAQTLPRPSNYLELFNSDGQIDNNDSNNDGAGNNHSSKNNEKKRRRNEIVTNLKKTLDEVGQEALKLNNNILEIQAKMLINNEEIDTEIRYQKKDD